MRRIWSIFMRVCRFGMSMKSVRTLFENFIVSELDAGKKITSLNSRIRGVRVFFKFCAERE